MVKFNLDEIENICGTNVYNIGVKKYHFNQVKDFQINDDLIEGTVVEQDKLCNVKIFNSSDIKFFCDCGSKDPCEHFAALAIKAVFDDISLFSSNANFTLLEFESKLTQLKKEDSTRETNQIDFDFVIDYKSNEYLSLGLIVKDDNKKNEIIFNKNSIKRIIYSNESVKSDLVKLIIDKNSVSSNIVLNSEVFSIFVNFLFKNNFKLYTINGNEIKLLLSKNILKLSLDTDNMQLIAFIMHDDSPITIENCKKIISDDQIFFISIDKVFRITPEDYELILLASDINSYKNDQFLSYLIEVCNYKNIDGFYDYLNFKNIKLLEYSPTLKLKSNIQRDIIIDFLFVTNLKISEFIKSELIVNYNDNIKYLRNIVYEKKLVSVLKQVGIEIENIDFKFIISNLEKKKYFISNSLNVLIKNNINIEYEINFWNNLKLKKSMPIEIEVTRSKNGWFVIDFESKSLENGSLNNILEKIIRKEEITDTDGNELIFEKRDYNFLKSLIKYKDINQKFEFRDYQLYSLESNFRTYEIKYDLSKDIVEMKNKILNLSDYNKLSKENCPEVKGILRDYQKKGVNWLIGLYEAGLSGILADDMGLGKTVQVLALLKYVKQVLNRNICSLIIVPVSTIYNWLLEIEKFTPELKVLMYTGKEREKKLADLSNYDIIITTYGLIRRFNEPITRKEFLYVILDEAQNIKNHKAITTNVIKKISSQYRLSVTGTPIENNLMELWSNFDFLLPGYISSKSSIFGSYQKTSTVEQIQEKDLNDIKLMIKPFILRRLKSDVLSDLPDKEENIQYIELSQDQKNLYRQIVEVVKMELLDIINEKGIENSQIHVLAALMKLRQICCHPKLLANYKPDHEVESAKFEFLKTFVKELLHENHKILIFSQFTSMLQIIKTWLESQNIHYCYIDGSQTANNRQKEISEFNSSDKFKVFLLSLKAGGVGINLTSADYVIHFDPWWNPAVEQQANDRAHRIGQNKKVFVYKLISKGTVEDKILEMQNEKKLLFDSLINEDRLVSKKLAKEDIEYLFEINDNYI